MADTPNTNINNAEAVFVNRNTCQSFSGRFSTTYLKLSGGTPCGEVIVYNADSTNGILINHENLSDGTKDFLVAPGKEFTFRGLTNSSQVSAKSTTGTVTIYWRTQLYSSNPL
jgi:hypothetical protein